MCDVASSDWKRAVCDDAGHASAADASGRMDDRHVAWSRVLRVTQQMNIVDVRPDGNCGFWTIAEAVGYEGDEGWRQVRMELFEELVRNVAMYRNVFQDDDRMTLDMDSPLSHRVAQQILGAPPNPPKAGRHKST
ncbi:hypothetical protein Scep_028335 [Stephania cephalantha]|uniref:OTU domain-containing protein n=1 Tax=Stephania cephalantha TaxID=152367 RepID=A0AAP0EDL2_9MAGN